MKGLPYTILALSFLAIYMPMMTVSALRESSGKREASSSSPSFHPRPVDFLRDVTPASLRRPRDNPWQRVGSSSSISRSSHTSSSSLSSGSSSLPSAPLTYDDLTLAQKRALEVWIRRGACPADISYRQVCERRLKELRRPHLIPFSR